MGMEQKPQTMGELLLHGTVYEPVAAARLAWHMAKEVFCEHQPPAAAEPHSSKKAGAAAVLWQGGLYFYR